MQSHIPQYGDAAGPAGRPTRRLLLRASLLTTVATLTPQAWAEAATKTTKKATKTTKKATTTTTTAAKPAASPTTTAPKAATKASGPVFDAAQELAIAFSYVAAGGFRVTNPYVAVYVQNDAGDLVRTIDLSVNTTGKGLRYVNELRFWYQLDQTQVAAGGKELVQTVSGATRLPGSYKFAWDGKDQNGSLVRQGTYVLCIEAAREHGPYELITEPIVLDGKPFTQKPADQGSVQGVVLDLRARA